MRAAFLGRFQPFHLGHKQVVEEYMDEFEELVLVIGSAGKSREEENPLTSEEREELIKECFPEIQVFHLDDRESDEKWIKDLEKKTGAETVISGNDFVKELVREHTEMEIEAQKLHDPEIYSGTETRRRIRSGEEWRYLTPKCAREKMEEFVEKIKKSGTQYEFEPGWKKENAYHGTADK